VSLDADSTATTWALAVSVGVSVGHSKESFGLAVSHNGTGVVNVIHNTVDSFISNSKVTSTNGTTVTIEAEDSSTVMADAGGVSIAVGLGKRSGAAAGLGESVAVNIVNNDVRTLSQTRSSGRWPNRSATSR
jgi:hypothetical protein